MLLYFVKWTKLFFSHKLNLTIIYTKGDKTLENIKANVAKNITQLRLAKGMTQLELAETLKTVDDLKSLTFAVENGSAGQGAATDNGLLPHHTRSDNLPSPVLPGKA